MFIKTLEERVLPPGFIFRVNKLVLSQYKTTGTRARNNQIADGTSMKWRMKTEKESQKI